jgi:ATP-dependent helicase Lhr and Lhr-like helicase
MVRHAFRLSRPNRNCADGRRSRKQGRDVLISAPTGSGKTLAAFLTAIDSLVRRARLGPLPDRMTEIVYVSPLKALSNDVHKNLEVPLAEIAALAASAASNWRPSAPRCAPATRRKPERQRMTRNRPHILVTTPESLYILLTAAKPREMLARVRTVIVDEIHAVADDKRGVAPGVDAGAPRPAGGTERRRGRRSASAFPPRSSRSRMSRAS